MPSRFLSVTFDSHKPGPVAAFWATLLGRELLPDDRGLLLPGNPTQVGLRFVAAPKKRAARLHLHLNTTSRDDQLRTVETVLRLGGRHIDVGQRPDEDHIVLGDVDGEAFCVIGPGNKFLAGCGHLAEVTCTGSRDVGLFWQLALGWPLVWDSQGETAVQSPLGGTKISWDGPPVPCKHGRNPGRFDLATTDVPAELQRLVALGATRLDDTDGEVELADPDGNEFRLLQQ